MNRTRRKGIDFSAEVAPLISRMEAVDEYRESLLRLQSVWDSLALLGQMSGTVTGIAATRTEFHALSNVLLDSLAKRLLANAAHRMRGAAQVAIDILVRNLFERTADIGFLATDAALRAFVSASAAGDAGDAADGTAAARRMAIEDRFRAYVAKYSVYDDIVVLSRDGRVLARLDRRVETHGPCRDALIEDAWLDRRPYVEHHGEADLLGGRTGLVYAKAIAGDKGRTVAVLALSFRFDDEMAAIFRQLIQTGDPSVVVLLDAAKTVVATSDPWQVPLHARLAVPPADGSCARLRFGGREMLAVHVSTNGYEGYGGPGWSACALLPTDAAFPLDGAEAADVDAAELDALAATLDAGGLFDDALLRIPAKARSIQRELARSLWNGQLQSRMKVESAAFAGTLLNEVSRTGERLREVFENATADLQRSTLDAVFDETRRHARLAIDIMERNLYERANDGRWWALDGVLERALGGDATAPAAATLRQINGLYTVYSLLLLFDAERRVVAVSDPRGEAWVGRTIDEEWARRALALRDPQSHVVSSHAATKLYGDRPTYVYAAALHGAGRGGSAVGGIALVFDGAPQFAAMLKDALPQGADGRPVGDAAGLFVDRSGLVVASTDVRWPVGAPAPLVGTALDLRRGESRVATVDLGGVAHAVGLAAGSGYREFHAGPSRSEDEVVAMIVVRLGRRVDAGRPRAAGFEAAPLPEGLAAAETIDVASFLVDGHWCGVPASSVAGAIQHPRVVALPNAPAHLLGMLEHERRMLPLFDLARMRGASEASESDAPVILLRLGGTLVALRVADLGPVFSARRDACKAIDGNADLVLRGARPHEMLVLIDLPTLFPRLRTAMVASEAGDGAPARDAEPASPHHGSTKPSPALAA